MDNEINIITDLIMDYNDGFYRIRCICGSIIKCDRKNKMQHMSKNKHKTILNKLLMENTCSVELTDTTLRKYYYRLLKQINCPEEYDMPKYYH
jgi:hypothetical protein